MQPYLIAIAVGYILNLTKDRKIVLNKVTTITYALQIMTDVKWLVTFAWMAALILLFASVYGVDVRYYAVHDKVPSAFVRALNNGLLRVAWAAGLGWIVFACFHGYGGK